MSITTVNGYVGATKQSVPWNRTASRTTVAFVPFSVFDLAGTPGAGTLAVGNTANGIVPTQALNGYPKINTITGTGHFSKVTFANTVASRLMLYECLFSAGAYSFNSNVTLTSQPSYVGRLPNSDYKGVELWLETVTAFTGLQSIAVTYTNQDGTTGRTTGTIATGVAPTVGRMLRLPLQAGDSGIQKIESVVSSVATVGTFNVHVMRKIEEARIKGANDSVTLTLVQTGMKQVYDTSAFRGIVIPDSTASGLPTIDFEIAQG